MGIANWTRADNALPFTLAVAELVEYPFDSLDADALDFIGLSKGESRSYRLIGRAGTADAYPGARSNVLAVVVDLPNHLVRSVATIVMLQSWEL
jgi:hypothetical protein